MRFSLPLRHLTLAMFAAALAACMGTNPKEPGAEAPAMPAAPVVPAMPVDPSLLHRYSFSKDAKDLVGKVDGTLKGTAKIAGGKLMLDGDGKESSDATLAYLEFAGPILPKSGSASIAIWFTAGEKTGNYAPRLLDIGDQEGNLGAAFIYFTPHFTTNDYARAAITATDAAAKSYIDTTPQLDDGKPHLVVLAFDATQMHVFIDGKEPTPATGLGNNTLANVRQVHNWLGRSGFDQDGGLTGSIDEVRTYNRTLTLADAAALLAAGPDKLP